MLFRSGRSHSTSVPEGAEAMTVDAAQVIREPSQQGSARVYVYVFRPQLYTAMNDDMLRGRGG